MEINRDDATAEHGGTVELRMRVCGGLGPRARMITLETRTVDRRVVARRRSYEPMGVDLTQVYPYECASGFRAGWVVPARLMRQPGPYHVTVWMVDGYGRRSAPVRASG